MSRKLALLFMILFCVTGCAGSSSPIASGDRGTFYVTAWYPTYDLSRGWISFSQHIRQFHEINPVWYNLNSNYFEAGQAPFTAHRPNYSQVTGLARNYGVKVVPTIQNFGATNFDPVIIEQIINSPQLRAKHIAEIIALVETNGYDGIDIDYENMTASDRSGFSTFISDLAAALHQQGKLLSVDVYGKTSDAATWIGPGAQDWTMLGKAADFIKIMAYDYHWSTSEPGPIAPLDWLEGILQYCRTIPVMRGKVLIGLPLYGLNWGTATAATEVMFDDAQGIARNYSLQPNRDDANGEHQNVELHFQYQDGSGSHTVYYQDAKAFKFRLELIANYRDMVTGITFWRLGGEDPLVWNELAKYQ